MKFRFISINGRLVRKWGDRVIQRKDGSPCVPFDYIFQEHQHHIASRPQELIFIKSRPVSFSNVILMEVQKLIQAHVVLFHLLLIENSTQVQGFVLNGQIIVERLIWFTCVMSAGHWPSIHGNRVHGAPNVFTVTVFECFIISVLIFDTFLHELIFTFCLSSSINSPFFQKPVNNFVHVFKVCLPYFSSILVTVNSFAKVFNSQLLDLKLSRRVRVIIRYCIPHQLLLLQSLLLYLLVSQLCRFGLHY